jgi:hypothetical protein
MVASATNQGKFLAEFRKPAGDAKAVWEGVLIEMTGTYADDPEQAKNLKAFYDRLARADFSAAETSFVSTLPRNVPAGFHMAGTKACRDCHGEECETWDHSGHASAWESLAHTGAQVDSDCQRCHTTGYGWAGGFLSAKKTPLHQNVGCESCHGPSRAHADDPAVSTAYSNQAANQCLKCHDPENSPLFVYEEYWPRIQHGFPLNAEKTP